MPEDIETRFGTLNYEFTRPLPKVGNEHVIGLIRDKLGGKIITKFVGLRAKTSRYLIYDSSKDKKARGTKKSVIKRKPKAENKKTA